MPGGSPSLTFDAVAAAKAQIGQAYLGSIVTFAYINLGLIAIILAAGPKIDAMLEKEGFRARFFTETFIGVIAAFDIFILVAIRALMG